MRLPIGLTGWVAMHSQETQDVEESKVNPPYSNRPLLRSFEGLNIPTTVPCASHYWVGD